MVKKALLLLIVLWGTVFSTALGDLAVSMQPDSWAEVAGTQGFNGGTIFTRCVHSSLAYCNEAVWDSVDKRVYFVGSGHGDWASSNCIAFIQYDDATNTWTTLPKPPFYSEMHHGYDHTAICADRREIFHKTSGGENLYKYNMTTGQWSFQAGTFNSGTDCRYGALEYFPDLGSLLYYREPYLWNLADKRWSSVNNPFQNRTPSGDWTYHCFAEYNPVHKVMIMGGGNGSINVYKMDTSRQIVQMNPAPFGLGINGSIEYADTRTGKFIVYAEDGSNRMFSYDVTTDTWTRLGADAPFRTDYANWRNLVGCYISTYSVGFYVQWDGSSSKIYLYRPPTGTAVARRVAEDRSGPEIEACPNPFRATVNINVRGQKPEARGQKVSLKIYDIAGRSVFHLASGLRPPASGVSWNASHLPPGVYYAVLRAGNYRTAKQLVLMK